jgi:hypothetical protein
MMFHHMEQTASTPHISKKTSAKRGLSREETEW